MPHTDVVFYQDDDENQTVLIHQWMKTLPAKVQDKCQAYLGQLEDLGHELRRPVADYLRDGIHELRPSYQGVQYRMLYFFPKQERSSVKGSKAVVVSHGFVKEGVVPGAEIDRAIARKRAFERRPERHTFRPARR
ncbi:MAG: type II toxin-antitoxin system RelE/ParE family toxin [Acidobacteriia bacterium]|nr:type II toxin-antitoxin system RelE/ParE family toxin [Terriglobia bacterium]